MAEVVPGRLPRGRHKLSRDEVEQSQRLRMVLAIADATAEKGYVGTSVADVLKRAGVSRETFYQQFSSKHDCFMSAFDAAADLLFTRIEQTVANVAGTPLERFDRAFTAYIQALVDHPAFARVFLVEIFAAGPEALDRRLERQNDIVNWICDLLDVGNDDRFAFDLVVAGIAAKVTRPLVTEDVDALWALHGEVLRLVRRLV